MANIDGIGERLVLARATMLATGGCGRLYTHTTNPPVATGDGIALAADAGVEIKNMEFMQFHPTTLYHPQMRSFLITEAVRGAGGTLRNHLGRRFMYDYDERLELAPRDIVARAIEAEMKKRSTWCVYLDVTHLPKDRLELEFPTIFQRLRTIQLEIEKDWIPVVPAQHYSCGGVTTEPTGAEPPMPGVCTHPAKSPAPVFTAPTGWQATVCWRRSVFSRGSGGGQRRRDVPLLSAGRYVLDAAMEHPRPAISEAMKRFGFAASMQHVMTEHVRYRSARITGACQKQAASRRSKHHVVEAVRQRSTLCALLHLSARNQEPHRHCRHCC